MTFATVRNGRIVDVIDAATLVELADWVADRAGQLTMLSLQPGESVSVGDRVEVAEQALVWVATLAARGA